MDFTKGRKAKARRKSLQKEARDKHNKFVSSVEKRSEKQSLSSRLFVTVVPKSKETEAMTVSRNSRRQAHLNRTNRRLARIGVEIGQIRQTMDNQSLATLLELERLENML